MTTVYPSGATPLRGRYLVRNPALRAALQLGDAALELVRSPSASRSIDAPKRLLLAVGGHLGDAVIATSVLSTLRRQFPSVEIGMVLPSWSAVVVEGHPELQWIHVTDHWRTSRANVRLAGKWLRYRSTRGRSITEIHDVGYDAAVDLYPYYPNFADVLWRSRIPVRVGYRSGGLGSLYTHATDWRDTRAHTSAQHLGLLSVLDPAIGARIDGPPLRYELPPLAPAIVSRADDLLQREGLKVGEFVLAHPGVGGSLKAWPVPRWRELTERVAAGGRRVVLTGAGPDETRIASEIAAGIAGAVNLCGRLDWSTFRAVIGRARLVVGADSVAVHLAAAHGVPCVAITAGMSDPMHWHPLGDRVEVVTHGVPCAPCFRSAGCATMSCVRDVSVGDVFDASGRVLNDGTGSDG